MTILMFPDLKDVPFTPFSASFLKFKFNENENQNTYDLFVLLGEFLDKIQNAKNEFNNLSSYKQLLSYSNNLIQWISTIDEHVCHCHDDLSQSFEHKSFQIVLHQIRKVYKHPILFSIWLGLEFYEKVSNTEAEREFLHNILVATHYENETRTQYDELLKLISHYFDVTELFNFSSDIEKGSPITDEKIQTFILKSSIMIFHLAENGHLDLLAAALHTYNYYLNVIDNKMLTQLYETAYKRVSSKLHKPYQEEDSIYALNSPCFDAHISKNNEFKLDLDENDFITSKKRSIAVPEEIKIVIAKLENNLNFVCEFRGHSTQFKTQTFLYSLKRIVEADISNRAKANTIEVYTASWFNWILQVYKEESILIEECVSLACALAVKFRNSQHSDTYAL